MSPSSLDAMEERLSEESRIEVRVDEAVTEPAYVDALPGQGALLAPAIQMTQCPDVMPSGFQTATQQRDHASRVSGASSAQASRNESEATPLSAPLLREHMLGRDQAERMGGFDTGALQTPRESSGGGDPRLDQLTLLMESMMTRMERLEGSERSSCRSGASQSRSFGDHGIARDSLGERYRGTRSRAGELSSPLASHSGYPCSHPGPA